MDMKRISLAPLTFTKDGGVTFLFGKESPRGKGIGSAESGSECRINSLVDTVPQRQVHSDVSARRTSDVSVWSREELCRSPTSYRFDVAARIDVDSLTDVDCSWSVFFPLFSRGFWQRR